jgi:predicted dehydrogenase
MRAPIGVGILGSGYMGRTYAHCLAEHTAGGRFVAVAEGTRAPALAADFGAAHEPSVEALLARPDIDAVILASPHSRHLPQAEAAAAAGKHVYIEKPMARSVAECDAIIAATDAAGVVLTINKVSRFREPQKTSKRLIEEGAIGTLRMIHGRHIHPEFILPNKGWLNDPAEGSRYLDWGAHANDLVRWYSGDEVDRVQADYRTFGGDPDLPQPQTAMIHLALRGGVMAQIWMSYEVPNRALGSSDQWILIGSDGIIECDNYGNVRLARGRSAAFGTDVPEDLWETVYVQPPLDYLANPFNAQRLTAFAAQTQDFIDAIAEGRLPAVTGRDGRAAVEIVEAADTAAATGETVRLPLSAASSGASRAGAASG